MSQISKKEIKSDGKILVAGWNGFGQWPVSEFCLTSFTEVELSKYLPDSTNAETFDICLEWGWNIVLFNSKIFIKGFWKDDFDQSCEIPNLSGVSFTNCVSNDQEISFYNTNDNYLWKYYIDDDIEEKWKKVPNFLESKKETISKVVSSIKMNIILSSTGRVFDSLKEISYSKINGKIIDIKCGHEHAMLLTDTGNVYTWGIGSRCQLGHGNTTSYDEPKFVEALGGVAIKKISTNGWHCCALSKSGDLYTWGWNDRGQLGIYQHAEAFQSDENSDAVGNKTDIENIHNISAKRKKCEPQTLSNYALPELIDIYNTDTNAIIETNIIDVSCGSKHTVIKLEDESFWGTGCNKHGQLGFDKSKFECVNRFTKLDVGPSHGYLNCGIWATAIIS